jgi:hypothetical protein
LLFYPEVGGIRFFHTFSISISVYFTFHGSRIGSKTFGYRTSHDTLGNRYIHDIKYNSYIKIAFDTYLPNFVASLSRRQ